MRLIAELRRRNVFRMAGLYLVGAWLVTQVAGTLLPMFEAPPWIARSVVGVLAIAFVPALVFSWIFELTPEGLKRDDGGVDDNAFAPRTAHRMNRIIAVLLLVAISYFAVDTFVLRPQREAALVAGTTAAIAEREARGRDTENAKSIAVLAFTDLSPGKDQEYFSDGMAEEILNSLARVDDLKVAGRTSSFSFKGRNEDLRAIGKALGVAHILEGSVRKQGDKVRITAQLIRSSDGFHLWSQTYDGDLKDVFELQERIAQAITDKLEIILRGDQINRLVNAGTTNVDAYGLYLQARTIFNRREGARFTDAIKMLDDAVVFDASYARAHALLAALYAIQGNYSVGDFESSMANVEAHARRASELDPTLAEPYAALGVALSERRRYVQAREALTHALRLEPNDVTAVFWSAGQLITTGYIRAGNEELDHALELDPLLPNALLWRGLSYFFDGDPDRAEPLFKRAANQGHTFVGLGQTRVDMARGDRNAAIASLTSALSAYYTQAFPPEAPATFANAVYGNDDAKAKAFALIDAYLATRPAVISGVVPYVLIRCGAASRALTLIQDKPTSNDTLSFQEMFRRGADVKGSPAFPEFARRSGLAALWDANGAPDYCRKNTAGDYVCE